MFENGERKRIIIVRANKSWQENKSRLNMIFFIPKTIHFKAPLMIFCLRNIVIMTNYNDYPASQISLGK